MQTQTTETFEQRMEQERNERARRRAQFENELPAIVDNLPGTWTIPNEGQYECSRTYRRTDDGAMLTFSMGDYGAPRPEVMPRVPQDPNDGTILTFRDFVKYGTPTPTATYALGRPAKTVAKEITRKVLTPLVEVLPKIAERFEKNIERVEAAEATIAGLEKALGKQRFSRYGAKAEKVTARSAWLVGPFQVDGFSGNAKLEITLPAATAIKVAEVLAAAGNIDRYN